MLHLVVHSHDPQDCPFRGKDAARSMIAALEAFVAPEPERRVEVKDSWASRGTHEIFLLVDAPDAHAVEDALLAAGLVARSHSRVLPVLHLTDALRSMSANA